MIGRQNREKQVIVCSCYVQSSNYSYRLGHRVHQIFCLKFGCGKYLIKAQDSLKFVNKFMSKKVQIFSCSWGPIFSCQWLGNSVFLLQVNLFRCSCMIEVLRHKEQGMIAEKQSQDKLLRQISLILVVASACRLHKSRNPQWLSTSISMQVLGRLRFHFLFRIFLCFSIFYKTLNMDFILILILIKS